MTEKEKAPTIDVEAGECECARYRYMEQQMHHYHALFVGMVMCSASLFGFLIMIICLALFV